MRLKIGIGTKDRKAKNKDREATNKNRKQGRVGRLKIRIGRLLHQVGSSLYPGLRSIFRHASLSYYDCVQRPQRLLA